MSYDVVAIALCAIALELPVVRATSLDGVRWQRQHHCRVGVALRSHTDAAPLPLPPLPLLPCRPSQ